MKRMLTLVPVAVVVAALAAGCGSSNSSSSSSPTSTPQTTANANLVQTAAGAGQFTTLVKLVKAAGLAGALSGTQKLTVFAPTDSAFAKVPKQTLAALAKDKAQLKKVLLYHVVSGQVNANQVVKLTSAKTLEGANVKIAVKNGKVYVNNALVTKTNVPASNGVIHVVNAVLLPPAQ